MIYLGSNEIAAIKLGNDDISAIYCGDNLIWPTSVTGWSVEPTAIEVTKNGGTENIIITSLSAWTITSSESWVTFSQASGDSGRTTVVATFPTYAGNTDRTATITVTDGVNISTISVTQKANAVLPDVAFLCNYNAKQFDGNRTIPKTSGQTFDYDMYLSSQVTSYDTSKITLSGQRFSKSFASNSGNPFNRTGTDNLTIVAKLGQGVDTSGAHSVMCCRVNNTYNWMLFNPANGSPKGMFFLHSSEGAYAKCPYIQMVDSTVPNIFALRVSSNTGFGQSYTDNQVFRSTGVTWGNQSTRVGFFCGGTDSAEIWKGDFYWIYVSPVALTDEQVLQVIRYNEEL